MATLNGKCEIYTRNLKRIGYGYRYACQFFNAAGPYAIFNLNHIRLSP